MVVFLHFLAAIFKNPRTQEAYAETIQLMRAEIAAGAKPLVRA
jgi:hypothetical protein